MSQYYNAQHTKNFRGFKGSGKSKKDAIIIDAPSDWAGVAREYSIIREKFGQRGIDWVLETQSLSHEDGKTFDELKIVLSDGKKISIFFDITSFY